MYSAAMRLCVFRTATRSRRKFIDASLPAPSGAGRDFPRSAAMTLKHTVRRPPAHVTVFHGGVLMQNHFSLAGETRYIGKPSYRK
jgi:hypothetical protein